MTQQAGASFPSRQSSGERTGARCTGEITKTENVRGAEEDSKRPARGIVEWSNVLGTAVTLMTLAVPVLYLMGLAFDQGYQSVFAVPESVRSSGFHEILTLGFFAVHYSVQIINKWMSEHWPLMAGYSAVAGVFVAVVLWRGNSWIHGPRQRLRVWLRARRNVANTAAAISTSFFIFLTPYVLVGLLYIVLSMPLLGYLVGKQMAQRNLERQAPTCELAAANPDKFSQCITAKGPNEILRGYLVAASSDYFVVALNGRTRAIPIDGWEFEATYEGSKSP